MAVSYKYDIIIISKNTTEITVYEVHNNGSEISIYTTTDSDVNSVIALAITDLQADYPGVSKMTPGTFVDQTSATTNLTTSNNTAATVTAATVAASGLTINSPLTDDMLKQKEDLKNKINGLQSIGLPSNIGQTVWEAIKPKLLSPRQVAKKMLMMQGQTSNPPILEEDAQLFIYGKYYYKNGVLFDDDKADPACVSKPSDKNYIAPIDENHPMWQKVLSMIKDLEDSLLQLGIKLGEFIIAIPSTIATIIISLVAAVSSAVILPPGSGIPTALTAIKTMVSAIKQLQAKTAEILPLLAIIDVIGLLLPKSAQGIIAQVNTIFAAFLLIITGLSSILGMLGKVSSKSSNSENKMNSIPLTVTPKADPANATQGQSVNLTANASGSDYNFTFVWTDALGNIIARDPNDTGDDDGSRTIIPYIANVLNPLILKTTTTTYTCKVTDGKGTVKQSTVTITRI